MDIRINAFPNSGFFYDLGYLLGAAMFLGGAGASRSLNREVTMKLILVKWINGASTVGQRTLPTFQV